MTPRHVLIGLGSRGDVEPFIALGEELVRRGKDVVVMVLEDVARDYTDVGVTVEPLPARMPTREYGRLIGSAARHGHHSQLLTLAGLQAWQDQIAAPVAGHLLARLVRGDVLVCGLLALQGGLALHVLRGHPIFAVLLAPNVPTRAGTSLVGAFLPNSRSALNLMAGHVSWAIGLHWSAPLSRAIGDLSGFGRAVHRDIEDALRDTPVILAADPHLAPVADDWRFPLRVTGAWRRRVSGTDSLEPALADFLDAGDGAVVVTFGSVARPYDAALFRSVTALANRRIVFVGPRGCGADLQVLAETAVQVESASHGALFSKAAGIVHHGGAGTSLAALASGRPSTVIWHQLDQRFNARRIDALGVGPSSRPRRRLKATQLAGIVRELTPGLDYSRFRARAEQAAATVVQDGVERAADIILGSRSS